MSAAAIKRPRRIASSNTAAAQHLEPAMPAALSRAARADAGVPQLEMPADVALTELARLLGRRAARQQRQNLGIGHVGLAPVLLIMAMAVGAVLIGFHVLRGF
jgi:hypothetical protein